MGLDMYAWAVPANQCKEAQVDYQPSKEEQSNTDELAYWRKVNHLHGWMERLYRHKGGTGTDFNCDSVRLNEEDLTALEQATNQEQLPHTPGFFFGGSVFNSDDIADIHKFILAARQAIKDGKAVFYDSWW